MTPLNERSACGADRYLQNTQQKKREEDRGTRTLNFSNQVASDSCLRPFGQRNGPVCTSTSLNSTAKNMTELCLCVCVCMCVTKNNQSYVCQSIYVAEVAANFRVL